MDDDLARPAVTPGNSPDNASQYDYWDHVEYVIDAAADRGLTVGMLPFFVAFGPGWDYLSPKNAEGYGRFIGQRFGDKPNIIWILGGDDRADTDTKRVVWDTMAKAITEAAVGSEDYSKLLMTYHSPGSTSSSFWLHDKPWLDFNMIQTWSAYTSIHERVTHDYRLTPVKPTGLGEGAYENGPEYPTKPITAHVIRKQAYWSYLSGGYHTYGNTSIWNFGIEAYYSKKPWKDALTDPGAVHVSIAARPAQVAAMVAAGARPVGHRARRRNRRRTECRRPIRRWLMRRHLPGGSREREHPHDQTGRQPGAGRLDGSENRRAHTGGRASQHGRTIVFPAGRLGGCSAAAGDKRPLAAEWIMSARPGCPHFFGRSGSRQDFRHCSAAETLGEFRYDRDSSRDT